MMICIALSLFLLRRFQNIMIAQQKSVLQLIYTDKNFISPGALVDFHFDVETSLRK